MKSYNRRQQKKIWLYSLPLILIIVLFVLNLFPLSLSRPVIFFLEPIWEIGDGVSEASMNISGLFKNKIRLEALNRRLIEENARLKSVILAKNQIEADNLYLRKIFGLKEQSPAKPVLAQVIFLPDLIPYNSLVIDIGEVNVNGNLKVGDWAISGAVIVGRVSEVGKTYSKIKLLSAEKKVTVTIGSQNIPALVSGDGAGNYSAILPKNSSIAVGDRVVAPLLGNRLVGIVRHISRLDAQPTETVLIKTPVNLWQLKWLEIYEASS